MANYHMEVCIDSIESAKSAIKGGATRIEACSDLSKGGLTPSPDLLKFIKTHSTIPVYAMIRSRDGNFVYTQDEMNAMLCDLIMLRDIGADGFVFGALKPDDTVDIDCCSKIVLAAKPKPITFHRAFDETRDPFQALEQIINVGFVRILTSGQQNTALEGLQLITELVRQADNRIIIMPGSGITPDNIELIKNKSGAKEFHSSARIRDTDTQNETLIVGNEKKLPLESINLMSVASATWIERMIEIIKN